MIKYAGIYLDVVELTTSINISTKTQEKEALQGSILDFFLLDTSKTVF